MDDKQFKQKAKKCRTYFDKYYLLLRELEEEYASRFGSNPSEVDDDFWIDTFHYGQGSFDFKTILEEAKRANEP